MSEEPRQRAWDMVGGAAATSLFLALEYDIEVWAADPWIDPTDNLARVRDAGLDRRVYPLRVDADALLFADGWFDALFSVDAYHYFGMRDHFLASYGHDNPDLASRFDHRCASSRRTQMDRQRRAGGPTRRRTPLLRTRLGTWFTHLVTRRR